MSFIKNKLDSIYFNYRPAPKVQNSKWYLNFDDSSVVELKYGEYTCPGIIIKPGESISSMVKLRKGKVILTGIAILNDYVKNYEHYNLTLNMSFTNNNQQNYNYNFTIPLDRGKTLMNSIGTYLRNKEFVEFKIDPETLAIDEGYYKFSIKCEYSLLNNKYHKNMFLPKIILKSPQNVNKKGINNSKHILVLGCESLTDPLWLMKIHEKNIYLPGFKLLLENGIFHKNSYSQQDGTLPFMASMATGLFSSQHLLGDYEQPIYNSKLNEKYKTLSKILKSQGFTTDAITPQGRWDTSYGWANGFDSFKVAPRGWLDSAPNSGNISRLITKNKNFDSFIFAHIDRMHIPLLQFVPSQSPSLHDLSVFQNIENNNFYPTVFEQMKNLDKIIYDIIQTLKYEKIFDNTLIILTGDHGISIPPNWKQGLEFSQYEEHIKVPYIVKNPTWANFKDKGLVVDTPNNASINIFREILDSLNLELPEYFKGTSQNKNIYRDFAFSETIYHPKHENYALSVISNDKKYWMMCKMDWDNLKMLKIYNEKLFFRGKNGFINENSDKINSSRKDRNYLNEIGIEFLKNNLSFYKRLNNNI